MLLADHTTLSAAAEVAGRQADHLRATDDYVRLHLGRVDAFRGVLSIFRDEYAAALGHVHAGIRASASRAELVREAFLRCRQEYADADGAAAGQLDVLGSDLAQMAPVVPDGRVGQPPTTDLHGAAGATSLPDLLLPGEDELDGSTTTQLLGQASAAATGLEDLRSGLEELGGTAEDLRRYHRFEDAP